MIKLNNYESPEVIILEIKDEDFITTSREGTGPTEEEW